MDAFQTNKYMMNGNKWNTFIFDLSFILRDILGIITLGPAEFFWLLRISCLPALRLMTH